MHKKNLIFSTAMCLSLLTFSQGTAFLKYSAIGIDDSLKKDANAVLRLDEGILEISSASRYTLKEHQIITILNKQGAHHLQHTYGFDKFSKIDDVEIVVYNELGIEIKKYKKKDFEIQSAYDGMSLVTDDKVMHLFTPSPGFPCTIEIKRQRSATGYLELPNWYMNTDHESIQIFRYVVKVPSDIDIRHRSKNFNLTPQIQTIGNQKIYTWETGNIKARQFESNIYEKSHYLPQIEIAPNQFEYDGHRGQFKTWKDFGEWNYSLYEQKDNPFTDQRISEIKAVVATQSDVNGKVAVLYNYLKKNMRYVSIQLGIGGFKPFPVRFVDEKKYGDCKALTNYMRNMLQTAGIKSYPALINSGYNKSPVDQTFPSSPFNHVILCVPNGKDSIWLECTSNSSESGFLGSSTENKNALLLTENGGILVPTPKSNFAKNTLHTRTEVLINSDGGAEASSLIFSTGDIYDIFNYLKQLSPEKKKELLIQFLKYKVPDSFLANEGKDSVGGYISNFKFSYEKLFDFNAGNKYFFAQRLNRLCNEELPEIESRISEYIFEYPYDKRDTTIFHLPQNFTIDNIPPVHEIKNNNAYYKNETLYDASTNIISVYTNLVLKKNIIQPNEYKDMATFFQSVNRNQNQKIVLKKE
jgi:hypothetical protein